MLSGPWKSIGASLVTACLMLFVVGVPSAVAATRFAVPGGMAPASSPCAAANPCSLFNAASETALGTALQAGDEVVVEPGNYSDAADLGTEKFVLIGENITLHGAVGQPRPVISLAANVTEAALIVQSGDKLSHLEITSTVPRSDLLVEAGTVDDVIARSSAVGAVVCSQVGGLIRNSACLGEAGQTKAIGAQSAFAGTARLRNVTAVASVGLEYKAFGPIAFVVDAVGVIADGGAGDVLAGGFGIGGGQAATVTVNLANSDYKEVQSLTGPNATITQPGSGANITAEPSLLGYRELVGAPTIDKGATDAESGQFDIDQEPRTMGNAADIGADEFPIATTTTTLSCTPGNLKFGTGMATCTATVASRSSGIPGGVVGFSPSTGKGVLGTGGHCTLSAAGEGKASCNVTYAPGVPGIHTIIATYAGDAGHDLSRGLAQLQVSADDARAAPSTRLTKKPKAKSSVRVAVFRFSSDQTGVHFQCKLDRGPFKACHSPLKRRVKPGRHSFKVRAVSSAGAVDPTPASVRWQVSG